MPSAQPAPALEPNAFIGMPNPPTDADLSTALGAAKPLWDDLIAALTADCGINVREWKSHSRKAGWTLRLARGKRTIIWITPLSGSFRVAFIFGEKAMLAAREAALPARVVRALDEAVKYPEGTGFRIPITGPRDLAAIRKLGRIKTQN